MPRTVVFSNGTGSGSMTICPLFSGAEPVSYTHLTDATPCKASLVAADVRVFVKFHVPRVGVAVGGFQSGGCLHSGNVLCGKLAFSALAAEPLHGRCHQDVYKRQGDNGMKMQIVKIGFGDRQ